MGYVTYGSYEKDERVRNKVSFQIAKPKNPGDQSQPEKKDVCFQIHMMITSLNTPRIPLIYKYSLTFYFPSSLFSIFLSYFLLLLYLGQHIDKMALVKNGTRKKSLKLTYSSKYRGENIIKSKKKVWL